MIKGLDTHPVAFASGILAGELTREIRGGMAFGITLLSSAYRIDAELVSASGAWGQDLYLPEKGRGAIAGLGATVGEQHGIHQLPPVPRNHAHPARSETN